MGRFLLTQMASVAELEAGLISERTKAALTAAKARGVKLGNPNEHERSGASRSATSKRWLRAGQRAANLRAIVDDLRRQGISSVRAIAAQLNERGILTLWWCMASNVSRSTAVATASLTPSGTARAEDGYQRV
jgi:DNA invertase Pin-like site-specific DNA recombinase